MEGATLHERVLRNEVVGEPCGSVALSGAHPAGSGFAEASDDGAHPPRERASRRPALRPRAARSPQPRPPAGPALAGAPPLPTPAALRAALCLSRRVQSGGAGPLGVRPHLRPGASGPGRAPGRRPPEPRSRPARRPAFRGRAAAGAVPHARVAGGRVLCALPRLGPRGPREPCSLPASRATSPRGWGDAGALGLPRDAGRRHHGPRRDPCRGRSLRPPSRLPLGARGPCHRPPGPVGGGGTSSVHCTQGPRPARCSGDFHGALGSVRSPGGPEESPGRA